MSTLTRESLRKMSTLLLCRSFKADFSVFDYQLLMLLKKQEQTSSDVSTLKWPSESFNEEDETLSKKYSIKNSIFLPPLRDCFNSIGLFLCHSPVLQTEKLQNLKNIKQRYIMSHFTKASLSPFFNLISSVTSPKQNLQSIVRVIQNKNSQNYDTAYHLVKLQDLKFLNFGKYAQNDKYIHNSDSFSCISKDIDQVCWKNPCQVLREYRMKKLRVNESQFILLNIMSKFHHYNDLIHFMNKCHYSSDNSREINPLLIFFGDYDYQDQQKVFKQQNQLVSQETKRYEKHFGDKIQKNRIVFYSKKLFQGEFDVESTIQTSIINAMRGSKEIWDEVQAYS